MACEKTAEARSRLLRGIAVCCPTARLGMACEKLSPKSGFPVRLRYRVHQEVVHRELRQVGDPSELVGPGRLAAGQSAKTVKADGICSLGSQVRVDEDFVAQFVFGVVVNVLWHVAIELLQGPRVDWIPSGRLRRISRNQLTGQRGEFVVLNSSQFGILQPQIAFDDLDCGQETQDCCVALGKRARALFRLLPFQIDCQQSTGRQRGSGDASPLEERAPPDNAVQLKINVFARRWSSRLGQLSSGYILCCHKSPSDPFETVLVSVIQLVNSTHWKPAYAAACSHVSSGSQRFVKGLSYDLRLRLKSFV